MSVRLLLALAGALVFAAQPARAQQPDPPDDARADSVSEDRVQAARVLLPAVLGSAGGAALGFVAGMHSGIGGGDDPGILGAFIFGMMGSVAGTAIGIEVGSLGDASFATSLGAGVAGILPGLALATAFAAAFDDDVYVFVGYSVGQGLVASLLAGALD